MSRSPARKGGAYSGDLLEARHIVKQFGALRANDDVSLKLQAGDIHALLGENGAGKSTLVKIIYGALQPTSGEIWWKGQQVTIASPAAARRLGIGMVFQHFSLFEALSVTENIALAMPPGEPMDKLAARIGRVSHDYGLPLEPGSIIADLSVGERQRVEIVRCLLSDPELLIMDEPTAVLTPQEAGQLFETLKQLAADGCAVLYISHRLEEVKKICHSATILRRGKVTASLDPQEKSVSELARLMVGANVHAIAPRRSEAKGSPRLELRGLTQIALNAFGVSLHDINLAVHGGEIVAIAGVAGNGQSELFEVLSGERLCESPGMILIDGVESGAISITERRKSGVAMVPEERLGHGAVPDFALSENILLTRHSADQELMRSGFVDYSKAQDLKTRVSKEFDVRKSGLDPDARSLSGGNLQKFIIGRELDRNPQILIISQPTWGVDAGAAALIRQALIDLARKGTAVLVISQDLDEIFEIADQIAVISRGHLSKTYPAREISLEQIGLLMAGAHEAETSEEREQSA
ncbi:MAG TPA: ABC transporter ATP-binding protein [Rhizobiales bacterium]|nr:ABC transporter ATP-binding protein [Hyphomicrobiales bacterium]